MGRKVMRVPVDFDWPLEQRWSGYLIPDSLHEHTCPDCEDGYSARAYELKQQWYGNVPFDPADKGSTPHTAQTPEVRAFAEQNVRQAPEYYGHGEAAVRREAERLARVVNRCWSNHLSQEEVDLLAEKDCLRHRTHTWTPGTGFTRIEPPVRPTADEVNRKYLFGVGLSSSALWVLTQEICAREGVPARCETCDGHGSVEAYEGQRAEADAWEPTDPPTGEGWQVWETVSEGSPITPVFVTREGLIEYLMSPNYGWGISSPMTREQAEAFTAAGESIGSFVMLDGTVIDGDKAVHELSDNDKDTD